ncbi:MAG: FAD binding domain-containing protein [Rhodobacteraceae bacterium]|nr:FAD binding domain-containing protein [Paracoccaceae bacterium]
MYDFEFERPATVADAVAALRTEGAQVLAGGQTIIPTMKNRLAQPVKLVSVGGIADMSGVSVGDGCLTVGAATCHADVAAAAAGAYPALASLAANIGDPAVRNRGTIGGSIANDDPASCYPAAVLASGADIITDRRRLAADDFFLGMFETALEEGELILEVSFPIPDAASYQKFEQPASRFALVGAFVARSGGLVRVAITGASDSGVFRWREAEAALSDDFSRSSLNGLALSPEGMISDIHGTPEYRAHLAGVLTARAVEAA